MRARFLASTGVGLHPVAAGAELELGLGLHRRGTAGARARGSAERGDDTRLAVVPARRWASACGAGGPSRGWTTTARRASPSSTNRLRAGSGRTAMRSESASSRAGPKTRRRGARSSASWTTSRPAVSISPAAIAGVSADRAGAVAGRGLVARADGDPARHQDSAARRRFTRSIRIFRCTTCAR